jgi:hypothetical protein
MKNVIKIKNILKAKAICRIAGFAVLAAVIGFSFAACDGFDLGSLIGGGDKDGGTLTITDIPAEYNGMYAMFYGSNDSSVGDVELVGAKNINFLTQVITLPRISNGKVSLSVWKQPDDHNSTSFPKYSGSDNVMGVIAILDSEIIDDDIQPVFTIIFDSIQFSKGSAEKSCKDAKDNSLTPGSGEGTLTVTDIPSEYNGKYAVFSGVSFGYAYVQLIGIQSYNASTQVFTLPGISDGKVSLSVWKDDHISAVGYSGSDDVQGGIVIYNSATIKSGDSPQPVVRIKFDSIQFSNGNAAISWSEGTEVES